MRVPCLGVDGAASGLSDRTGVDSMAEERRIAVVTGGNRGMGLETCRQLGRRGYRVILTSRESHFQGAGPLMRLP